MKHFRISIAGVVCFFILVVCCEAGIVVNDLGGGEISVFISPVMDMSCDEFNFELVYDTSEVAYNNNYAFWGTPCNFPMGTLSSDAANGVLTVTASWFDEIADIDFLEVYFLVSNPVADGVSDFFFENATILNSSGSSFYSQVPSEGEDFYDIIPEPMTIILMAFGGVFLRKNKGINTISG